MSDLLIRNGATEFLQKHSPARAAVRELGDLYFSFFSFSVVRNPWDQVVSFYEHLRKPLCMSHAALRRQYSDFDEVLNPKKGGKLALEAYFTPWCESIYRDRVDDDYCFNDLTYFTHDSDGKQIVNFVGKFERLEEDINHILAHIGIPRRRMFIRNQMPLKNKSKRNNYRQYYTPYTRDIVHAAFINTIENYGYEF